MRRASTLFSNGAVFSARNQRLFVPTVTQIRYGGSHAHEPPPPPLPLHKTAKFTIEEVNDLFKQYTTFIKSNNTCMVSKEQFSEFLDSLGIEQTPRNVCSFKYNKQNYLLKNIRLIIILDVLRNHTGRLFV